MLAVGKTSPGTVGMTIIRGPHGLCWDRASPPIGNMFHGSLMFGGAADDGTTQERQGVTQDKQALRAPEVSQVLWDRERAIELPFSSQHVICTLGMMRMTVVDLRKEVFSFPTGIMRRAASRDRRLVRL